MCIAVIEASKQAFDVLSGCNLSILQPPGWVDRLTCTTGEINTSLGLAKIFDSSYMCKIGSATRIYAACSDSCTLGWQKIIVSS